MPICTYSSGGTDEGGGYLVEFPDIPGCMSDGDTLEEAIANGRQALKDCSAVSTVSPSSRNPDAKSPRPKSSDGQWRQRPSKTLYAKLTEQAGLEGVSVNTFVTAIIAEVIGARQPRRSR